MRVDDLTNNEYDLQRQVQEEQREKGEKQRMVEELEAKCSSLMEQVKSMTDAHNDMQILHPFPFFFSFFSLICG